MTATPAGDRARARDFDPNRFGLDPGTRLLEASAGTGKTYALAHLVLRLVVERGLSLQQLLVVTFTEAAAAELRDRIGRRLSEALHGLQRTPDDAVLAQWIEQRRSSRGGAVQADRGRLLLALEELHRADITTIHGFCLRSLQRSGLEAALPLHCRLERDPTTLLQAISHDYWQQQVLPMPAWLLRGLKASRIGPDALQILLARWDADPSLELPPLPAGLLHDQPLTDQLPVLVERDWQRMRTLWHEQAGALQEGLCAAAARWKQEGQPTSPYTVKPRKDRVAPISGWLAAHREPDPAALGKGRELEDLCAYFHPGAYWKAALKAGELSPRLPEAGLQKAIARVCEGPGERLLLHFSHWALAELDRRRHRRGALGYGDLLRGLDPRGPARGADALQAALRKRYRAALIDEFQDTDPLQWRILAGAFAGQPGHLLVMVGDPKQAIYRFRGGDLDTYRRARAGADRVVSLADNHRTDPPLIDALNALMAPGLRRSDLPVPPVRARARGLRLQLPQGESPLQLLWLPEAQADGMEPQGKGELDRTIPGRVAAAVRNLLDRRLELVPADADPSSGPTGQPGGRCLGAGDVCLIVDTHRQAEAHRHALERVGLPSRLVSKGDVLASPGARVLQRLLDALAHPGDPGRLRLLAVSPLLGWSAARLSESECWDRLAAHIDGLARVLPERGLLGCLSELLEDGALAFLARDGRLLADLQQSTELVQDAMHRQGLGALAAVDWLRQQRLAPEQGSVADERQPNSSLAEDAVRVITVHRSKGLEFPVVICPTLWAGISAGPRGGLPLPRWQPEGAEAPRIDLHLDPRWGDGRLAAEEDRRARAAERERLAYVAMTRARHLLLLAWTPVKRRGGGEPGPLNGLLFPDQIPESEPGTVGEWRACLEAAVASRGLPLRIWDGGSEGREAAPSPSVAGQGAGEDLGLGPVPDRPLGQRWARSSYSTWVRQAAAVPALEREEGRDVDAADGSASDQSRPVEEAGDLPAIPSDWPRHGPLESFPRGARAGDCLHRILERLEYGPSADLQARERLVDQTLEEAALPAEQRGPLLRALEQLFATPFGGALGSLRLADLPRERRLNELAFDLPLAIRSDFGEEPEPSGSPVSSRALARLFRRHGGVHTRAYADRLERLTVSTRGFLTGAIDLVFCDDRGDRPPRWWLLDWKSTWSGERDADGAVQACGPAHYSRERMATLIEEHHYPLQTQLYLVALHRYLRWRLPGYDPARHLGGSVVVFLRGAPGPCPADPSGVPGMWVEPVHLERLLAIDALMHGEEAA
ncbi:DNA helicase UvrD [Synechococcus sp. RSCCF101]|uniref:UvrD-helicase domain-containing protein n=1 Tax=Synechococcus sp. RSCCF101 TaxID=2511069 RepID=UPI0012482806|nr:UvrD-helicase domain-containing protein [Synechococcus sp. RSCCF101]QEY31161.1 DNA helicase UvrD [Synechococcus sp. RSCCF101]